MTTEAATAAAADRLAAALAENRASPSAARERELINLRLAAFREREWPDPVPGAIDRPPAISRSSLSELPAAALDAEALRDGIQGAGGVIVRGLIDAETVAGLRGQLDRAFAARHAAALDDGSPVDERWYGRASGVVGGPQQFASQGRAPQQAGSLWAVDSPATAFTLCELYHALGLPALLAGYFGEPGVLSARKWVLRKVPPKPTRNAGWHQDGRFLGDGIRTVNLWIALSDCGEGASAPGMELIGGREPVIHPTGTDGALFDWTVGPELVERLCAERPLLYPRFAPGDALFFDHYNLHRTGTGPADSGFRYAVESWFFAASTAPAKQQPLLL
ncbi:phytanoyl-CoA dioxygenase family protein [Pseudohaliea sp.]|uniref:phytanoyl-CoA dioxygenase family protein n=1 Tax=Pseudohaliea sp. TaxID=2740289 RepID=UPI0032EE7BED